MKIKLQNVVFYDPKIVIGDWVYIAYGCWFSGGYGVKIADEEMFGPYVVIATANHTRKNQSFRFGDPEGDEILFKMGCWVGAHCTILAGSMVGEGTVIGANTVVNGIIPNDCMVVGNMGVVKKKADQQSF